MSRTDRKKRERQRQRAKRKAKIKKNLKNRLEEFKLNRKGKTKRKRTKVMERYRRTDRLLTALVAIAALLLIITWIIILYY